jgi:hypothetical protein
MDDDDDRFTSEYRREAEHMHMEQQRAVDTGDRFQYRGTPEREKRIPSRTRRRQQQQQRYSQDVAEQVNCAVKFLPRHLLTCFNAFRFR